MEQLTLVRFRGSLATLTPEKLEVVQDAIEEYGGQFRSSQFLNGPWDFEVHYEVQDEAAVPKIWLTVARHGLDIETQTMTCVPTKTVVNSLREIAQKVRTPA